LSIDDQSISSADKLDKGHLTHYNLADANYTEETNNGPKRIKPTQFATPKYSVAI